MKRLYRYYRLFNTTFLYEINSTLKKAKLTAFRSATIKIEYNPKKEFLTQFIEKNKFITMHYYDYQDYQEIKGKPFYMFISPKKLLDIQKVQLQNLSEKYSSKMQFGWTDDRYIAKDLGVSVKDVPISVYQSDRCIAKTKFRISDLEKIHFFEETETGNACDYDFWVGKKMKKTILGYEFSFAFIVVCLSINLFLRSKMSSPTVKVD
ncbi:hypothetical protein TVAG_291900 [Trichomonas vaginalis G3]|uniref:Uncharacterized protein n=1 Tax=Trichomonas vaginalis (strain ATCC PRA-98 / G3) TaxID=412133 RepID=A2DQX0_TRIV3|nr:hypothetical protein TVAGG3_0936690 [Trichomonas vaginalis G3]EAY17237.1 hypothetical protein TVAG_291900 [Trichomonas vaginalis G3]KAI5486231.1 hypothetical protein TVAGG3_0936690 [Trichomonas vaginalis G3]|eukprot:XP_001329460.1 hypothetical protein [Trichomonas vaginalis G3]